MRTTCVATMLSAGHAPNALPQRADANVNCRIFPGHSQEDIRLALVHMFNDPMLTIRYRNDAGELTDHGSDRKAMVPPALRTDVMESLRKAAAKLWSGAPVIPTMVTGSSDSIYTMYAGIPSYGISGVAIDRDDHARQGRAAQSRFVLHRRRVLLPVPQGIDGGRPLTMRPTGNA